MPLIHGSTTVSTASSPVQATTDPRRLLKLWAKGAVTNSGVQYISGVSSVGVELGSGEIPFDFTTKDGTASTIKASEIHFDSSTDNEAVKWTMLVA